MLLTVVGFLMAHPFPEQLLVMEKWCQAVLSSLGEARRDTPFEHLIEPLDEFTSSET